MSLQDTFHTSMRSLGLSPSTPVFLAISGGVDSVVLSHLLQVSGYQPIWLHMNFQLRGEESNRDQHFVEQLAANWKQDLRVSTVDAKAFAQKNQLSIQEAARQLRYEWFAACLREAGPEAVLLTAHHADDNAETLLMNFLRGTGIRGLTGIPVVNDRLRRPLLSMSRAELEDYARQHSLSFVEDSSNRSTDYTRNQIRLELMPLLRSIYPQVDKNLQHNIERFKSVQSIYQQAVRRWFRKYVVCSGVEQQVSVALLMQPENRAMIHEWLSGHGFTEKQEGELMRLAQSQSGHFILSGNGKYRIVRHRKHFILSPVKPEGDTEIWIEEGSSAVSVGTLRLEWKRLTEGAEERSASPDTAMLDGQAVRFPLLLRKVRPGDYFYPLGLNKKKKLARFLIDLKLSAPDKEKIWVLESDQRIVWVVGYRIDHRFRLHENTRSILRIDLFR